jgi:hypothetical protein
MLDRRFKALMKIPSVALISLSVISACTVEKNSNISAAQSSIPAVSASPAIQASSSQDQHIYGCNASNGKQMYVVDQLSPTSDNFDVAIYNGEDSYSNYVGTVQINVTQKGGDVVGRGQTSKSTIEVNALGRTPAFFVRDSVNGQASGRCYVQWEMANNQTRRLVRQCLAFAARKFGSLAEVQRNACIGAPGSYLEELKRQK